MGHQSKTQDEFAAQLASLISKEAVSCKGNSARFGHMIERVASALGFTIAIASGGDGATISRLMAGAESYAMEEAVHKSRIAKMMSP